MISLGPFLGRIPGKASKALPDGYAQVATNCDLSTGHLVPMANSANSTAAAKAGDLRSLFKLDDTWIAWTATVHAVLSELANTDHKFYWTGDGYPKQATKTMATSGDPSTYPTTTRRLGVIAPTAALTMAFHAIDGGTIGSTIVDSVSYEYTYVTADGEESKPSPVSAVVDIHDNEGVTLTGFVVPNLATTGNDVTHFRVYRLVTGSSGSAEYQAVPWTYNSGDPDYDMPVSETQFVDENTSTNRLKTASGEVCPTEGWDHPPDDMDSLQHFSNGSMVGRSGNTICFSEPTIPSAWPSSYRRNVAGTFVAMAALREVVLVSTVKSLYAFYGADPSYLQKVPLEDDQPCVAPYGMVPIRGKGIYYPSNDGLVLHNGMVGATLDGLFTKKQWRALGPQNMLLVLFDDKLHIFIKGSSTGFIVDITKEVPTVIELSLSSNIWAAQVDPVDDALYLLVEDGGTYYIRDLNNGSGSRTMTYQNAERSYNGQWPGYARIRGDQSPSTPINLKIYNDGVLEDDIDVTNEDIFSLSPFCAGDVYLQIEGTTKVESVLVAVDPEGI